METTMKEEGKNKKREEEKQVRKIQKKVEERERKMKKRKEKKQGLAWKGTIKELVGNGKIEYCKHFSWKQVEKRDQLLNTLLCSQH